LTVLGGAAGGISASVGIIAQVESVAPDQNGNLISHIWQTPVTPGTSGGATWGDMNDDGTTLFEFYPGGPAVHGVSFAWNHDPLVSSSFNVSAGPANTPFTVNSALLSFSTIPIAYGTASAAVSVTDSATFGDVGSFTFTGQQPGGNSFAARYNGPIAGPNTTFVNLLPGFAGSGIGGFTQTASGANPSFPAPDAVAGSPSDMHSQFKFALSRFDRASGTSTFEIVPAPGSAALLGLGGLIAGRRRRNSGN